MIGLLIEAMCSCDETAAGQWNRPWLAVESDFRRLYSATEFIVLKNEVHMIFMDHSPIYCCHHSNQNVDWYAREESHVSFERYGSSFSEKPT